MVDIVVARGAGIVFGDDIIDPLLASTTAAIERGRIELDKNSTDGQQESLVAVFRTGLRRGQLIEVQDALQGVNWRGVISGIKHNARGPERITTIQVARV